MKNQIDLVFQAAKKNKRKALIAYLAAGYPAFTEETTLIKAMEQAGVDILELGVPFSDPIADGPTIQFASQRALEEGTTLTGILSWVKKLKAQVRFPIVLMTYMNPVLAFGIEKFAKSAAASGVSGIIVPDLIPEEGGLLEQAFAKEGIHLIYLVAPTTPAGRKRMIVKKTGGFVYAVSVAGVTGARKSYSASTSSWLKRLKQESPKPVCVGFGISGPDQIRRLKGSVDGFIVGSALIDLIRRSKKNERVNRMKQFIRRLSKECGHAD